MPRILYVQFTNPGAYPPLEHSSRILADAGWQVLFLGTGALGADRLRFASHPRIEVRQLRFQNAGWRQKLHYIRFCMWCVWWALRWRPDWIYASDMLSCPAALGLTFLRSAQLLYHEHDSPSTRPSTAFGRLCHAARRRCAGRARLCVLPNHERATRFIFETKPGNPVEVVWNCPLKSEVISASASKSSQGLRLLYHGSIVPERLPLSVLDALVLLPADVTLTVVGYETIGSRGYISRLGRRASELKISERLTFVEALPRAGLLELCPSHHVGLALFPPEALDVNLQAMTGASNKPFDYLASGLAVLVSDLPDWREMFVRAGFGLSCDSSQPDSIASAIRKFYELPAEMRAMAQRGRQKILDDWNYEAQFAKVQCLLANEV